MFRHSSTHSPHPHGSGAFLFLGKKGKKRGKKELLPSCLFPGHRWYAPRKKECAVSGLIDLAFDYCMGEEGNALYTDDPRDPGGPTKYGIALNANRTTIPDKDGNGIINAEDVKLLSREDAKRIFVQKYWTPNHGNELPPAIAFYYVDCCFNPGPGAAARLLQQSLYSIGFGVVIDGRVGPKTLVAARVAEPEKLLPELAARRQMYYASRKGFGTYGLGWTRRVSRCLVQALNLANK